MASYEKKKLDKFSRFYKIFFIAIFMLAASPDLLHAATIYGHATVLSGESLSIRGLLIRLAGVAAPNLRQYCTDAQGKLYACGRAAEITLAEKIVNRLVECVELRAERYPRGAAVCQVEGEDLGGWLIRSGLAVADREFATNYGAQEEQAREARRGVWSGTFTFPWDWRRGVRRQSDGFAMPFGPQPLATSEQTKRRTSRLWQDPRR